MSVTVRELINSNQKYFQLKLLAGDKGLDYVCTWVHMMEDAKISEFFWGNELVVTSGYSLEDEDTFIENLKMLLDKNCTGVVVNTGPYIAELSQKVIDFCQEQDLPLISMPWNRSMTEFTRTCCTQITRSTVDDERLAEAIMQIVHSPEDHIEEMEQVNDHFNSENGFVFLSINTKLEEKHKKFEQKVRIRIETAMRGCGFPYMVFRHEKHYLIFFNEKSEETAKEMSERIYNTIKAGFPTSRVNIGIGEPVEDLRRLNFAYQSAEGARKHVTLTKDHTAQFSKIGFLKLFYTVSDDSVLLNFYHEMMDPILEYEEAKHKEGVYTETLFRYILSDCSLKEVSAAMFVHENTILYRMNKIKEMLENDLGTLSKRQPYLMAYYCGHILKLVPDYID